MRAGFHGVRLEFKGEMQSLENRLNDRIDGLEERIEQVRQTQLEDSQAIKTLVN